MRKTRVKYTPSLTEIVSAAGLIVLIMIFLGACTKVGQVLPGERVRGLQPGQGAVQTFSYEGLDVKYLTAREGDRLMIEGYVSHRLPLETLDVYLLFVDRQGVVLDQKQLYSSGYSISRGWSKGSGFSETFKVPADAEGISFSASFIRSRGHQ